MLPRVTVFTRNNCAACVGTKSYLTSKSIAFDEVNVEEDNEGVAQWLVDEGWRAMPVIRVQFDNEPENDAWWSGTQRDRMDALVG